MKANVIAYCRVSTGNQKSEGTVELQVKAIKDYCKLSNLNLVSVFKDEAISGGLENRLGLSELLLYLEKHSDISSVIIWKLDRLARDLYLQEHLIRKLEELNVTLISVKEPNLSSDDPMRKAFRQFIGIVSELEKAYITMRLSAGRINKARKGQYAGGRPAYGYRVKNKSIVTDTAKKQIVQSIYHMKRYKRMSYHSIAQELNDTQVKTANGGQWYAGTVRYILANRLYKGVSSYKGIVTKSSHLAFL